MKVTNGGDDDGSVGVGGVGEGGRCVGWREVVEEMEKEGEEEEELWHWEGNGGTCMGWIDRGCLNECAGSSVKVHVRSFVNAKKGAGGRRPEKQNFVIEDHERNGRHCGFRS